MGKSRYYLAENLLSIGIIIFLCFKKVYPKTKQIPISKTHHWFIVGRNQVHQFICLIFTIAELCRQGIRGIMGSAGD